MPDASVGGLPGWLFCFPVFVLESGVGRGSLFDFSGESGGSPVRGDDVGGQSGTFWPGTGSAGVDSGQLSGAGVCPACGSGFGLGMPSPSCPSEALTVCSASTGQLARNDTGRRTTGGTTGRRTGSIPERKTKGVRGHRTRGIAGHKTRGVREHRTSGITGRRTRGIMGCKTRGRTGLGARGIVAPRARGRMGRRVRNCRRHLASGQEIGGSSSPGLRPVCA